MNNTPLTRQQMKDVINGVSSAPRIPMMIHFWTYPEVFEDKQNIVEELLNKYPMDANVTKIKMPRVFDAPEDTPSYRWVNFDDPDKGKKTGIDEKGAISDWSMWEDVLKDFPSPEYEGLFSDKSPEDGRYHLGMWWYCLFERHWSLRGMTNSLIDFYENPKQVHALYRALTDFYLRVIERSKEELNLDGIFVSDDIGMQTGAFFSKTIFDEFFKPYYKELVDKAHSLDMHFWLHTCGNVESFLPSFIEIGIDVIHPIQKHTMVEKEISKKYGSDICIWAGFDVQQIIPYGTPSEVRKEVRFMIDTYYRKDGRFILTAGNGITEDCKIESLEALLDETLKYGTNKISK
ncbi:MAG: hypothetical protein KAG94_02370 [Clostridiales bacterium]|nr:hypothetical protein [Clostridiales bacterium]